MIAAEWLRELETIEKKLLNASGAQVQEVLGELMPRIRLAAMEAKSREVTVNINIQYNLSDPTGPNMRIDGQVAFPEKVIQKEGPISV